MDSRARPVVIASNRGPVSYHLVDGEVVGRRGGGGLVAGLGSLGERGTAGDAEPVCWIAVAASPGDRHVAATGRRIDAGFDVTLLDLDPEVQRRYYDVVSNQTLWFTHHGLFDSSREPSFDDDWFDSWAAYRTVNERFAESIAETAAIGAVVLVQDYHLALVGRLLGRLRPDLASVHFHHTPFATPDELAVLPDQVREELLDGLRGHTACGFHTQRWASRLDGVPTFTAPLGIDATALRASASSPQCDAEVAQLLEHVGDRQLIARVDRIELSKNLIRGFDAFDQLLQRDNSLRERVVFAAFCYPSREGVAAYGRYRLDVEARVAEINSRWSTPDWTPIMWEGDDDYPRSLAALRVCDVLMVNPIRDGLNLVAIEGSILNEVNGSLVLSSESGAAAQLGDCADVVSPFDVSATTTALAAGLARSPDRRRAQAAQRRNGALVRTPDAWLADQLHAAG